MVTQHTAQKNKQNFNSKFPHKEILSLDNRGIYQITMI